MVALAAWQRIRRGEAPSPLDLEARPYLPLEDASHAQGVE